MRQLGKEVCLAEETAAGRLVFQACGSRVASEDSGMAACSTNSAGRAPVCGGHALCVGLPLKTHYQLPRPVRCCYHSVA